jgi:steroid 5-alpha reductase family enzyme
VSAPFLLASSVGALCALFALAFALARRIDNYGIVDIAWSYAFGALALAYGLLGGGWGGRRALTAAMVAAWSLRLGTHLLLRVSRRHPEEDGRYRQLRREWGPRLAPRMAWFFQAQAVSVGVLGIPFLAACENPRPGLGPLEVAGLVLWAVAIGGEALADAQLSAFAARPENLGRVCEAGLWRYSRHPNYFFEWLVWVSYFLFGCGSPWGWAGVLSPACILFLLLRVTGIPATEEQSLRSRGDAYRRYQATTSPFIPLPRRKALP